MDNKVALLDNADFYASRAADNTNPLETRMYCAARALDLILKVLMSEASPTTASPTTTAPTVHSLLAAESCQCLECQARRASTTPTTPPSLLSDTKTDAVGPAGPGSGCAHAGLNERDLWDGKKTIFGWCERCGALRQNGVWKLPALTLVPAAGQDTLTSVKQDSKSFVDPSVAESATSASNESSDGEVVSGEGCTCGREYWIPLAQMGMNNPQVATACTNCGALWRVGRLLPLRPLIAGEQEES